MLFIKSIFHSSLAVFWSHLLFVFTSLSFQLSLFFIDSPGTCSLQLFIASPSLVLSCLVTSLSNSPENLADCFSAWDQIITLQSFCQPFSLLVSSLSAGAVLMWRNASSLQLDIVSRKPQTSGSGKPCNKTKTLFQCKNDSIDYLLWAKFLCLHIIFTARHF